MKNMISYLYNIEIESINKYEDKYLIKTSKTNYIMCFIDETKLDNINKIVDILSNNNVNTYTFKYNVYNELISKDNNDNKYVLVNVNNDYDSKIDFIEMLEFYDKSSFYLKNLIKYQNIWNMLWESKINYLKNHFKNNFTNNKHVVIYFYYYISLAESALLYISRLKNNQNYNVCLTHRRMDYRCKKIDFYNPLNYIIDLKVRDIAEYIKSLYYKKEDYINDLDYFLKTNSLSYYEASMLYARIIYPSYFFDAYEKNSFNKINLNTNEYENFIKKIYEIINSYIKIDRINWLN